MKPHFPKLNYRLIMGWLFIISIPAIPVSWLFFSPGVLLCTLIFFACMFFYQMLEVFYDEYIERRRVHNAINVSRKLEQEASDTIERLNKKSA